MLLYRLGFSLSMVWAASCRARRLEAMAVCRVSSWPVTCWEMPVICRRAVAIYPSQYFPQSYLFNGTEGKLDSAPFDALEIAIDEAHDAGLRLEAWVSTAPVSL